MAYEDLEACAAYLERGLVERSVEARLVLLGAVAREHVLFVGPPGVAKSLLCRRLGDLFGEDAFFEIALTRFTTPDDVFGRAGKGCEGGQLQRLISRSLSTRFG